MRNSRFTEPQIMAVCFSSTLMNWAEKRGIVLTYIQPRKPQQNDYVERYNRTVRNEWLDLYVFDTV